MYVKLAKPNHFNFCQRHFTAPFLPQSYIHSVRSPYLPLFLWTLLIPDLMLFLLPGLVLSLLPKFQSPSYIITPAFSIPNHCIHPHSNPCACPYPRPHSCCWPCSSRCLSSFQRYSHPHSRACLFAFLSSALIRSPFPSSFPSYVPIHYCTIYTVVRSFFVSFSLF